MKLFEECTRKSHSFGCLLAKTNYKFVKLQICYREYLWLLSVKHNKKETEVDSAGREMPVIADGDGEQEKKSMSTLC